MRLAKLTPFLFLFACGDNLEPGVNPDGSVTVDSVPGSDADVDPDAPTDGDVDPTGAVTRVWALGDFLSNDPRQAASFLDSDAMPPAFPYTMAAPPPIVLPASGELSGEHFDARAGKIAFVADLTVPNRFDLYVANADGSSPTLRVQGGGLNEEITAPLISPDGTKIAYLKDSTLLNGAEDLWVVSTLTDDPPVRVSPTRPLLALNQAQMDVFPSFTWSPSSRYIAFSADLNTAGVDQAWVVDTQAATIEAVELLAESDITATSGTRGVRGTLRWDNANNVYFRARVSDASNQFTLFKAGVTGTASRSVIPLPARADSSTPDVGNFALSADGTKILFSADAPTAGQYNLFVQEVGGSTATNLTNVTVDGNINHNGPMELSPDGTELAVLASFDDPVGDEPYVIELDGSGMRRLATFAAGCTMNCAYTDIAWTADGKYVYVVADPLVNNETKLFRLDASMTDQDPTLAVDIVSGGDVFGMVLAPVLAN